MLRECAICHKEFSEYDMVQINTGRVHWFCWECYKKGQGEVTGLETQSRRKKMKEAHKK